MDFNTVINTIISQDQYLLSQKEKEEILFPILMDRIQENAKISDQLLKFYTSLGNNQLKFIKMSDIPPIPVSMFKKFDLKTCADKDISRVLKSSATTTGTPSKIFINKETGFRQSKALISILRNYLGSKRRPVLVIDTENVNKGNSDSLSARGAAIRGISNFGTKIEYIMDEKNNDLVLNVEKLQKFVTEYKDQDILISGFTFIIWTQFVKQIKELGIKLHFPNCKLVHSGGWKKLTAQAVSKEIFSNTLAEIFDTKPQNIIDFYGMVEQLGVIFLDCEEGFKHIPDFADVIIKNFYSMEENPIGIPGLIEILSIIPNSYPGQAIITEDVGELIGIDDCKCGRKGKYFKFRSRVEKTETRGCGDTFAEKKKELK